MNQKDSQGDYISESDDQQYQLLDSSELINLTAKGNQVAFIELYHRYYRGIYNFICRLIHDRIGAEDVLQEVFIAVWKGSMRFRAQSKVNTWIYRIAYNQSISWLRVHRELAWPDYLEEMPVEDAVLRSDVLERQKLLQVLSQLSVKHRSVIELTFVQGMTYREIAETLHIPVGTVKSRMNYAVKMMAKAMNETGFTRKHE